MLTPCSPNRSHIPVRTLTPPCPNITLIIYLNILIILSLLHLVAHGQGELGFITPLELSEETLRSLPNAARTQLTTGEGTVIYLPMDPAARSTLATGTAFAEVYTEHDH